MANHPSSMRDSESGNNKKQKFKLTTEMEKSLIFHMIRLKPCGTNKHLSMLFLQEILSKEFKLMVPTSSIWNYLESQWNIEIADEIENTLFNTDNKNFTLPEEYYQLIYEEEEKIKKVQEKKCLNDEINKRKLSVGFGSTRSRSNSMFSIDSKYGFNETVPISLIQNSFVEKNYNRSEDASNTRRLLRYNDKPEAKEQDNLLNKNLPNQSNNLEKFEKVPRKFPLILSHNNKQTRNYTVDLKVSDKSSRSVTPEIVKGKTSNIHVTPVSKNSKSNLGSSDNDLKSKFASENGCIKNGNELITLENKVEDLKVIEVIHKVKEKIRRRVTSDQLIVLQSPEQPLGRRSYSNKST